MISDDIESEGFNICAECGFSWCECGTEDITQEETMKGRNGMQITFSVALTRLKDGLKVARSGWNGKGMFLYHVPANFYSAQTEAAKSYFGEKIPYGAYIAIKNAQGYVVPWQPSQDDMLAEDWEIVQ